MELALESTVVIATASLAAASLTAAFEYFTEREWHAVVFLTLAASVFVWYGYVAMVVVRAAYGIS